MRRLPCRYRTISRRTRLVEKSDPVVRRCWSAALISLLLGSVPHSSRQVAKRDAVAFVQGDRFIGVQPLLLQGAERDGGALVDEKASLGATNRACQAQLAGGIED